MKIGILVVAYNAASTLAGVLDRIPPEFRSKVSEIVVSDDRQDSTYLVGLGYRQTSDLPITVIRQPHNLGYGGIRKPAAMRSITASTSSSSSTAMGSTPPNRCPRSSRRSNTASATPFSTLG